MSGVNKVFLLGRLGQDPKINQTESGKAVANFSLATSESWTDKSGEKQERTTWHKIVVWGRLAEVCGDFLRKGSQVFVEGKIQIREYTDSDGAKRISFEIQAESIQFLSQSEGGQGKAKASSDANEFFGS